MRRIVMTGKTVDEAVEAACTQLGVSRDDLNVTYQVLEMPVRKLFKSVPARVEVMVEEEETPAAPETAPVQEVAPAVEEAAPAPAPVEEAPAPALVEEAPAPPAGTGCPCAGRGSCPRAGPGRGSRRGRRRDRSAAGH